MNTKPALKRISTILATLIVIATLVLTSGSTLAGSSQWQSFIVQGQSAEAVANVVTLHGGLVTAKLDIIRGVAATLLPETVAALRAETAVTALTPNSEVQAVGNGGGEDGGKDKEKANKDDANKDDGKEDGGAGAKSPATDYADVTGADVVWQQGVTGAGITVAIIDTGLALHRGLYRNTDGKQKSRVVGWVDFVQNKRQPVDPNGHGTHIAGIIANSQMGTDGEWNGMAPAVKLVAVRVLDETGAGTYERVIQGIQWVIEHKAEYNIRVINLSLVSPVQSPYWADPLDQAVMQAWANGIVVVVAAGNGGSQPMTIGVPGNTPYVITAGAFTDNYTPNNWNDDYIAPFSAAGPTLEGFVKPDVVAPGAHMVSTMLPKSYIAKNHLANQVANQYFSMAGTSQAAAVTSGIAALILARNPGLTPDQVKYRLMATAYPWVDPTTTEAGYSIWQQGAGRVNAPDAVFADIQGVANAGMDIQSDLAGATHYEGFSYYDETTGTFRLKGDFSTWEGGYGAWSGGYGAWSGGYGAWSGGYGAWSGGYGAWSGSEPWAGSTYANAAFVENYLSGNTPSASAMTTFINNWVEEPSR